MGKEIVTKRIAWYADKGKSYTYSGSTFRPDQWNELLLEIKKYVEQYMNFQFNSVLLNEYPNGKVGMGWHSDDERERTDRDHCIFKLWRKQRFHFQTQNR